MKSLMGLFLMLAMALTFTACGDKGSNRSSNSDRDYRYRDRDYDRFDRNRTFNNGFNNGCVPGQIPIYMGTGYPICTASNGMNMQNFQTDWYWHNNSAHWGYVQGGVPMYNGVMYDQFGNQFDPNNPDHCDPYAWEAGTQFVVGLGSLANGNGLLETMLGSWLAGKATSGICSASNRKYRMAGIDEGSAADDIGSGSDGDDGLSSVETPEDEPFKVAPGPEGIDEVMTGPSVFTKESEAILDRRK